jgi:hypothetical protein
VLEEDTDSRPETLAVADDRTGPDDDGGPDGDTNGTGGYATTEADSAGGGDQVAEPPEPGENSGENPETRRTNPGVRAAGAGSPAADSGDSAGGGGLPGDDILLPGRSSPRADREPWEPVEGAALRPVLDEYGVAHLLDDGVLGRTSP